MSLVSYMILIFFLLDLLGASRFLSFFIFLGFDGIGLIFYFLFVVFIGNILQEYLVNKLPRLNILNGGEELERSRIRKYNVFYLGVHCYRYYIHSM